MKTSEILARAADEIEVKGWCKHVMYLKGRMCALGAIYAVRRGTDDEAATYLREVLDIRYVSAWNDRQLSRIPVIQALRDASSAAAFDGK